MSRGETELEKVLKQKLPNIKSIDKMFDRLLSELDAELEDALLEIHFELE